MYATPVRSNPPVPGAPKRDKNLPRPSSADLAFLAFHAPSFEDLPYTPGRVGPNDPPGAPRANRSAASPIKGPVIQCSLF